MMKTRYDCGTEIIKSASAAADMAKFRRRRAIVWCSPSLPRLRLARAQRGQSETVSGLGADADAQDDVACVQVFADCHRVIRMATLAAELIAEHQEIAQITQES
ncbi:unnamed protein product [Cylicocyclus nassatus]|uniref:Uncharacterized protein n=1 Tax=Cylicocyclus nassatus TaxID=53992 RepID=A0AA36HGA4_CYLNA|nr:unnamed protein product [Cylicocyclus nassatus]